ncbi:leucine-rich repeat-containing protein 2 isoform X3 [Neoarius graeffei]|uniref:leucine-rich repeat-containing protein 2 isoform X3 n=1 Tax=Neoarius graeffei TaxID=443677 RepID=UPI00298D02C2|nr:leucine-rich repeat-containing protein 2 isoform X3 [Neoarius graeffei]
MWIAFHSGKQTAKASKNEYIERIHTEEALFYSGIVNMRVDRIGSDIPVYDLSVIRNLWECRVKKYKQRQKKEQERINKSALAKINQEWQYRIVCRKMKTKEITALQCYLERSAFAEMDILPTVHTSTDSEDKKFIFELSGDKWRKLPEDLQYMTYLREWHIHRTQIQKLPEYIEQFVDLCVLDMPKNRFTQLPAEIGKLANLKELNMNYNKLSSIPPELGECENLEKLEMTANLDLSELPFELSNLKKLKHLDLAENKFATIPVSVLRMSSLQWLDISKNSLRDLPEDIDRLEELQTLFLHKNKLKYLPMSTANIVTLKMLVVSGDELTCIPAGLTENPALKFIKLFDNPISLDVSEDKKDNTLEQTEHDKEFMQTYIETLKDRAHRISKQVLHKADLTYKAQENWVRGSRPCCDVSGRTRCSSLAVLLWFYSMEMAHENTGELSSASSSSSGSLELCLSLPNRIYDSLPSLPFASRC